MTPIRIIALTALLLLLLIIGRSCSAIAPSEDQAAETKPAENRHIAQLSEVCHATWQQYDWRIGEHRALARDSIAFSNGIKRICRARAELFFEGYELSPFIAADDQHSIFPIVFIPTVDEVKSVIRQNLPALRVI